jgi:hypothetical protein
MRYLILRIDGEFVVRDELHKIVQNLARKVRTTQAIISRAHSTHSEDMKPILEITATQIEERRLPPRRNREPAPLLQI